MAKPEARWPAALVLIAAAGCSSAGPSENALGVGTGDASAGGTDGTSGGSSGSSNPGAGGGSAGRSAGGAKNGGGTSAGGGGAANGGTSNGTGGTSNGTGGASNGTGGASNGTGGRGPADAGSTRTPCKRGIATNTAPGSAFFPAITWWYNWAMTPSGADVGIEFTPMMWGSSSVNTAIRGGSKYVLTFNEPNFKSQSNLTAAQAASYWPTIEAKAAAAGVPIVSPAMNYCGPTANCNGTSPYQYLKDFFAACTNCKVDYVAVHWYNCDLPSLQDYLEPGGNLEGFEQFGKPIWLTEFSCDGSATVADQEAYMRKAIPYLEGNPHVFRYSWFSAGPIPNAQLIADGAPTALGNVYIGLDQSCP